MDLSTAILQLSENGELQRIHEKWLKTNACSQNQELDANRLHLKSFWGLFLICGVACFLALLIYFILVLRQFNRRCREEGELLSHGSGSSSSRIMTFLKIADEKQESKSLSNRKSKDASLNGNINYAGTSST